MNSELALLFSFLVPIGRVMHFVVVVGSDEKEEVACFKS